MNKSAKRGFTLAELLIVVAILGILVAIAIPIFNFQLKKAQIAADDANIRSAYSVFRAAEATGMVSLEGSGSAAAPADSDNFYFTENGTLTTDISKAYVLQADHPDCKLFTSEGSGVFQHKKGTRITITYTKASDSWSFSPTPAATT